MSNKSLGSSIQVAPSSPSEPMRRLVAQAYEQKGLAVKIPPEVFRQACGDLPAQTSAEILRIRRREILT